MNPLTWLLSKLTKRDVTRQRTKIVTFHRKGKNKQVTSISQKVGEGKRRQVKSKPSKDEERMQKQFVRALAGGQVVTPLSPKEIKKLVRKVTKSK